MIFTSKMAGKNVRITAILLAVCAPALAGPSSAPSAPDPAVQSRILQTQLDGLQRQLDDSRKANKVLSDQNTALLQRLATAGTTPGHVTPAPGTLFGIKPPASKTPAANTPAPVIPPGPIVVTLIDPTWDANGTAAAQKLQENLDASAFVLKAADETLSADAVDATHTTLSIRKINRGLGTVSYAPVAKLMLEAGALSLRWTDQATEPTAMAALKFAVIQLTGPNDTKSIIQFFKPAEVVIDLSHPSTTKVPIPADLPGTAKLKQIPGVSVPEGWQVARASDAQIAMKADDANWSVSYASAQLFFTRSGSGQQRLTAANAELKNRQTDLEKLQASQNNDAGATGSNSNNGNNGATGQNPRRAEIAEQVKAMNKQIATLNQVITALQTQIATDDKQWSALVGTQLLLETPNGLRIASITLTGDR